MAILRAKPVPICVRVFVENPLIAIVSNGSLVLAERGGWALRAAECGPATARLEQGSHPPPHSAMKNEKGPQRGPFVFLAERGGFEPPVRYKRTLAFQASALSHSATSPNFQLPVGIDSNRLRAILTLRAPQLTLLRRQLLRNWSNPRYAINVHSLSKRAP